MNYHSIINSIIFDNSNISIIQGQVNEIGVKYFSGPIWAWIAFQSKLWTKTETNTKEGYLMHYCLLLLLLNEGMSMIENLGWVGFGI